MESMNLTLDDIIELTLEVGARCPVRLGFGPGERRQKQRGQNRHDGNDDQQLDQRETGP